jgi:rRNA maturation protein Nop10
MRCPDCGAPVTVHGHGHRYACRARGRGALVDRCGQCGEWIDQRAPWRWHLLGCTAPRPDQGALPIAELGQVVDGDIRNSLAKARSKRSSSSARATAPPLFALELEEA